MSFTDTILASGFKGKLMFDLMAWNGDGHVHRVSRYASTDPGVIANQLTLIKLAGGAGVRVTWQGPQDSFIHQAAMQICDQCSRAGMLFALLINPQVNGQSNWWTDPGFLAMTNSPAYIPEKWLSDFTTGIDYTKVTLPAGFSVLQNQKGFGWLNAYNGDNPTTLAQIQSTNRLATMRWPFLALSFRDAGVPTPSGVKPSAFTGTRDYSQGVWSTAVNVRAPRAVDHQAGNMFHDCVAALSLCSTAPYCAMVWNDADEESGVEHFLSAFYGLRVGQ